MATPTLTPGSDQDERLNPGQQDYDRRFNDIAQAEERGTVNDSEFAKDSDTQNNIDSSGRGVSNSEASQPWNNAVEPPSNGKGAADNKTLWAQIAGGLKKKGPLAGITGGVGIMGLILGGMFGNSMLLPSLTNSAIATNDSSGTMLERRLVSVLENKIMPHDSSICATKPAVCKGKRLPNHMLSAMNAKGIVAFDRDTPRNISGNGYADSKPSHYEFTDSKGNKLKITAAEFSSTYKNNPEFRKAFKGAYNMRYRGFVGKYMATNFFKKFGVGRTGGIAKDGLNKENATSRINDKLRTPSSVKGSGAKATIETRLARYMEKLGIRTTKAAGDPIIVTGAVGCAAIGAPLFAANTVRAVMAAQLISIVHEIIFSPGSMQQAGDIDGDAVSALGDRFTDRPLNEDGTRGNSALDSKVLQSAIGVNSNPVDVSFSPAYELLSSGVMQMGIAAGIGTKGMCDVINSPQAMTVSAGIWAGVSAGTAGVGSVVRAALWASAKAVAAVASVERVMEILSDMGVVSAIADLAWNFAEDAIGDQYEGLEGEEFGDAVGMGMLVFSSSAGTGGSGAVLTTDQVAGFNELAQQVEADYKEEAIATLSPFDISSPYTFLGSIVSELSLNSAGDSNLHTGISMFGNILKTPLSYISKINSASASDAAVQRCSYAKYFGIDEKIAINAAGFPCAGVPKEYMGMSPDTVIELAVGGDFEENVIDPNTGEIIGDSDVALMMMDCAEGDLDSVSGCVIDDINPTESTTISACTVESEDVAGNITFSDDCAEKVIESQSFDVRKRAAQSLYIIDTRIDNILAGIDEEDFIEEVDPESIDIPDANAQQYAQMVLSSGKVTDRTGQLQQIIDGSRTNVSANILRPMAILAMTENFTVSSMKRDVAISAGAGNKSLHLQGQAFDISGSAGVNGVAFGYNEHNPTIQAFINKAAAAMPNNCEIGVPNQSYVNATKPHAKSGCYVFVDKGTGPHIHLGVKD